MRVKVWVLFWFFLLIAGALVRKEIAQLSSRIHIDPAPSNPAERTAVDRVGR